MTENIGRPIRTGTQATLFALDFMPKAKPFTVPAPGGTGVPVMLYPGQRLLDGGIVIGKLDGVHIYIAREGKIYESLASAFVSRTMLLNDVSSRIQRSMWLATVGEAELEFIFVVCATLVGTVGTALAAGEFLCSKIDGYYEHKRAIDVVSQNIRPIVYALSRFRTSCPVLFDYLILAFLGTAGNALDRAWQGITLKDVAYFVGKFVAYAMKSHGNFALGLTEAVRWTTVMRSLGITGGSLVTELEKTAAQLRSLGQTAIGREQLSRLASSACVLRPDIQHALQELCRHLDSVVKNLGPLLQVASPKI